MGNSSCKIHIKVENKMKKIIIGICLSLMLLSTSIITADWDPDDDHKMHFPQLPDIDGWDVYATSLENDTGVMLADDWRCIQGGPVTDIHFWGSWLNDVKGSIDVFRIGIFSNIPADQSPTGYSMPGNLLWLQHFNMWEERVYDSPGQGFFYPQHDEYIQLDHNTYYQYNIMDIQDPLVQKKGTIYWLSITAFVKQAEPGTVQPIWGWKSSENHWNDDAVWTFIDTIQWIEMYEPPDFQQSLDLAFVIDGEPVEDPCIEVDKKVYDKKNQSWVEEIDAQIGDTVRFQINIHNCGGYDLYNIEVKDMLPACLEYTGEAIPYTPQINGKNLTWSFDGPLPFCHNITIEFSAIVVSEGKNVNNVNVSADSIGGQVNASDTAVVQVGKDLVEDLFCEGQINWDNIRPGAMVTSSIAVYNIGDPNSELNWSICNTPSWGTWVFSPNSGTNLMPTASPTVINVTAIAPSGINSNYAGQIKICNDENSSDFCFIDVILTTPKHKFSSLPLFFSIVEQYMDTFPWMKILYNILV